MAVLSRIIDGFPRSVWSQSWYLSFSLFSSDLFLRTHWRRRLLSLHLIIFNDTHARTHTHTHTHKSLRCRDLYLTTHNIYKRQTSCLRRDLHPQSQNRASPAFLGESFNSAVTTLHSQVKFSLKKKLREIYACLFMISHGEILVQREEKAVLLWQGKWEVVLKYLRVLRLTSSIYFYLLQLLIDWTR
jgi:hypothetical protein